MSQDKKFVIRCRAIILHEGKLLVVKHKKDASFYALPGGHLEWGEDVKGCLSRELVEELGVKPEIGRLLYISTFIEKTTNTQPMEFFFEIINGKDYLDIEKLFRSHAHELAEIYWASPKDSIKILPEKFAEDFNNNSFDFKETRYIKDSIIDYKNL